MPKIKPENLVGRQVYFKMSKQVYKKMRADFNCLGYTPYKLYTIVKVVESYPYIQDDDGTYRSLFLKLPAQDMATLGFKARWTLKRRAK